MYTWTGCVVRSQVYTGPFRTLLTMLSKRQSWHAHCVPVCACTPASSSPAFTFKNPGCDIFKDGGDCCWAGPASLHVVCCQVLRFHSFSCRFEEDVSLTRDMEKEAAVFPNSPAWLASGTYDPLARVNKYFQCRAETSPQPTLHNCRVWYEGLQGACQSLFLNSLMIYLMPLDI